MSIFKLGKNMSYKFNRNSDQIVKPIDTKFLAIKDQFHLYDLLSECWSLETCAPRLRNEWNKCNKTCGQCSITAFLVQDIFGGEVYGIKTGSGVHCFNKIGDIWFDLTSEQFEKPNELEYIFDASQSRDEHFLKEEKYQRYLLLKKLLKSHLE